MVSNPSFTAGTVPAGTLAGLLAGLPDGILVTDRRGSVLWANAAALRLLELDEPAFPVTLGDLAQKLALLGPGGEALDPGDWPPARAAAGETLHGDDLVLLTPDGTRRMLRFTGGPLELDGGDPGGWVQVRGVDDESAVLEELREERDLVTALVEHSPLAIAVVRVPELTVELGNRTFAAFASGTEPVGQRLDEVWPGLGRTGLLEVLGQVVATGQPSTVQDVPVEFAGPSQRHYWLRFSRLPQPDGRPTRILLVARETTAEVAARDEAEEIAARRARDLARSKITSARLKSLVDLSTVMARIEGLDELLHLVTAEAVRLLGGDSGSLFLLTERGTELAGRAAVGMDPGVILGLRMDLSVWREVAEVMRTGIPSVHTRASEVSGPEAPFIRRFEIQSYVGVLLGTPARPLGMLFVNFSATVHRFTPAELAFVETLTSYLTVAIERRRLVEGLREAVSSLQTALLPESFPNVDDLSIAAQYRSASEEAQVGGDFYDVVRLADGRVAAVVGDVCGKGVAAARHTARLRYDLRAVLDEERDGPGAALAAFNARVFDEFAEDEFVTMALVVIDPRDGTVEWASAGHPPPLLTGSGSGLPDQPGGLPVGLFAEVDYGTGRLRMPPGATLVMYTDGVIEARSAIGTEFGFEGVQAALAASDADSAEQLAGDLLEAVTMHAGGALTDDAAVLVLRRPARA